jgi:transcriptional regulator with XRE-family HTH domain
MGQLADASGVDKGLISRMESGETQNPKPSSLNNLAAALDIAPDELHEAAGYFDEALPSPAVYFRSKYGELPDAAVEDLERYVERLQKKYGRRRPKPGEDEQPSPPRSNPRARRRT